MRVLLVEDDANLRFGVAAALRAAGLAVDEAVDLPQADEALFVTAYDCAVFDRMLPSGTPPTMWRSSGGADGPFRCCSSPHGTPSPTGWRVRPGR